MTPCLRALLAGSIDYAGMFPPAGLTLANSLDNLRRHRRSLDSWLLGRFVVSVAKLAELAESYQFERDGRLSVVVTAGDSGESFLKQLDMALMSVADFPVYGAVDTLEFRWPAGSLRVADVGRLGNLVQTAAGEIMGSRIAPITMFFELPRGEIPLAASTARERIRGALAAVADFNKSANGLPCLAGFKMRCGGAGPAGIPSSAEIAAVICESRDHGVVWKATAGLHHPVRRMEPAGRPSTHGFLNLLVATVLADVHRLDERRTQAIIDSVNVDQFGFSGDTLNWDDLSVTSAQIVVARERSLRSFGSCSVDEPCHDLKGLGFL
jgi:hypothetical protein